MKLFNVSIDKNDFTVFVSCNFNTDMSITVIISDLFSDVVYEKYSGSVGSGYFIYISPLNFRLLECIRNNPNFPGFIVKIYSEEKRLLQAEKIVLNKDAKSFFRNLHVDQFDSNAASYIDFFYGDMCKDLDVSGTIVDGGANFGFFTLYAKYFGARKIYSIEPDPLPFYYLQKNLESQSNIILLNKAVNINDDGMNLNLCIKSSVASGEFFNAEKMYTIWTPTISIDTILKIESEINLLKLDIEGTEFKVIEHMGQECFDKINQLFIEFHSFPKPISEKLIKSGYNIKYINSTENDSSGFIYAKK